MPKNTELLREDWEPKPAGALYTAQWEPEWGTASHTGEALP